MIAAPPCRHFGICGGCAYQDMPPAEYRAFKRYGIVDALARNGHADADVAETVEVGAGTRRRAVFKAAKENGAVLFGFHAAASHAIVDMRECLVLTPGLFALVSGLREMMQALLDEGEKAELSVTETPDGADVAIRWKRVSTPAGTAAAARWAARLKLARITVNGETLIALATPSVEFGRARVTLPPGGFLQPTASGETILQAQVLSRAEGAKTVADLFAGCGTFALVLAQYARVHAVENDKDALDALAAGARGASGLKPVTTERRDLFKLPLSASELARFDAVVLDPPRVGAAAQAKELARSAVRRVIYVSCNPTSFARDARTLTEGGYGLGTVVPVDQFLWSSHIELVALFSRD